MAIQPQFYETLYLVRPDIKADDLTTIQDKVTKAINSGQGEISRDEKWAERDLAYPINDYTRGTYYIVEFKALPSVIANIEKHLAFHNVDVLRFMTVSIEEPSAKTADAPAPEAPKAPSKETTPPPSAPPSTPEASSPQTESATVKTPPEASVAPESAPAEESTPEPPAAAESAPAEETSTPPESASEEDTSDTSTSGFTAAPPLSSEEDEKEGDS